jgi:transglutaminase-like putative cysteine protease
MTYKLIHKTKYDYSGRVNTYHGLACLQPLSNQKQKCTVFEISIQPEPSELNTRVDFFGNTLHYFNINTAHKELIVEAKSQVESYFTDLSVLNLNMSSTEVDAYFKRNPLLKNDLWLYFIKSHFIDWDQEIKDFAQPSFRDDTPLYQCVQDLCHRIFTEFEFNSAYTEINTPLKVVLRNRKGVCQDFSHLAIACIRSMGFAARYVSGYLETRPPAGKAKLQGSDASHAWISVYIPEVGWCDFDPTNNLIPQERHIVTAYGRDYADVVPLKGIIFSAGGHKLKVEVDVIPIFEK